MRIINVSRESSLYYEFNIIRVLDSFPSISNISSILLIIEALALPCFNNYVNMHNMKEFE